ncbi:MAG: hypothetical protein HOP15_12925 [Planctomycetes bacterium]|nr:hypothetical protein [Planctomycetota bacterium]
MKLLAVLLMALFVGCSDFEVGSAGAAAETPEELVRRMLATIAEQSARPEHGASEVTIQHLLVGVSGGVAGITRAPLEAEGLAAELLARAQNGEDFDLLVKNHTDEVHPGIYTLSALHADPPRVYARAGMVVGLGDLAWRLEVGELGVAPYDGGIPGHTPKSPRGYHLVKRLK